MRTTISKAKAKAKAKTQAKRSKRPRPSAAHAAALNLQLQPEATGIDVGAEEFVAALPPGREQVHLMQKTLTQMNLKLQQVLSDIDGTSAPAIIDAILGGERDPAFRR